MVAYGLPCDLIAATPIEPGLPSFAMNSSTGESISPLPTHPTVGYAIDTVNGVEYSVRKTPLLSHLNAKNTITLPRQARDKNGKQLRKKAISAGGGRRAHRLLLRRRWRWRRHERRCAVDGRSAPSSGVRWRRILVVQDCGGEKTHLLRCHLILKMIILPRQARDKLGESAQKEMRFLTGCVNDRAHEAAHGAKNAFVAQLYAKS